jgi:hypothetical protein
MGIGLVERRHHFLPEDGRGRILSPTESISLVDRSRRVVHAQTCRVFGRSIEPGIEE